MPMGFSRMAVYFLIVCAAVCDDRADRRLSSGFLNGMASARSKPQTRFCTERKVVNHGQLGQRGNLRAPVPPVTSGGRKRLRVRSQVTRHTAASGASFKVARNCFIAGDSIRFFLDRKSTRLNSSHLG